MTNTYFKKSQNDDLKKLKKKISQVKQKYRSKQTNMSFNLEEYLHNKKNLADKVVLDQKNKLKSIK